MAIAVTSVVDVSRIYQEEVNYTQPENAVIGNDGIRGIIGSRVYSYNIGRDEDQVVGGAVGTETNADISTYVEQNYQPDGQERNLSASGEDIYNVDTKTTQRESAGGTVTDVTVSVFINAGRGTIDQEAMIHSIAVAAGITTEQENAKVALLVEPWPEPEPPAPYIPTLFEQYEWVIYAAIAGLILFLLLLLIIILLIRRHRKKKRLAQEAEEAAAMAAMQPQLPDVNADIMDIHTERSMELRKDVRRFAENNPEIAALMVKNWLKEEDGK